MSIITFDMVTSFEPNRFVTEASTVGLLPGQFPEFLDTTLGNRQRLGRVVLDNERAVYRQVCGCITVTILND